MKLSIKTNAKTFEQSLNRKANKQIPYAGMVALNNVAFKIRAAEQEAMDKHLANPTPFTRRGVRVKKASKKHLVARVFIAPIQAGYLKYEVDGGTRTPKKRALVIPAMQKVNKYGNMPKGTIKRLLKNPKVFSGVPRGKGNRPAGIYKRMGSKRNRKLRLMIRYHQKATYRKQLPFYETAARTAQLHFQREYAKAMDRALRTAK